MIFNVGSGSTGKLVHLHISYDPSLAGANITATNGNEVYTAVADNSGLTVISGKSLGDWTVSEDMFGTSAVISTTFYGNYNAGLGGGVFITVNVTTDFIGKTLTLTNGSKTYTRVASGSSVLFVVADYGTWTVSGVVAGETYSNSIEVTEDGNYSMELSVITTPDGSTVTPVDDIQTWLKCAEINKSYTTINEVLADNTTLNALISDNNASDYMARSSAWSSAVCVNQTAMTFIGNNNYCANKLLSNSTWCTAICDSTYFEKVLNTKVPTISASDDRISVNAGTNPVWYPFDNNDNTGMYMEARYLPSGEDYLISFDFEQTVYVKKFEIKCKSVDSGTQTGVFYIESSNDKTEWKNLTDSITISASSLKSYVDNINDNEGYRYYRIRQLRSNCNVMICTLQFYGREEV